MKNRSQKQTKNIVKLIIWKSDFHVHCFLWLKRETMISSPDRPDPADRPDPVHGLPLGTSPTRAGGQDDVNSQANSLKHEHATCSGKVVCYVLDQFGAVHCLRLRSLDKWKGSLFVWLCVCLFVREDCTVCRQCVCLFYECRLHCLQKSVAFMHANYVILQKQCVCIQKKKHPLSQPARPQHARRRITVVCVCVCVVCACVLVFFCVLFFFIYIYIYEL